MGFGLRLNTGPVVSFIVNEEQDFKQTAATIFSGSYKDQAIAWQFGAGLDIKKLGIDLRYEQGINKLNKTVNTDTKINLFTFGLAYRL
jgi:predicted porin